MEIRIKFLDIYILRAYREHDGQRLSHQHVLGTEPDWDGYVNQMLTAEGVITEDGTPVDFSRGRKLKGKDVFMGGVRLLRKLGLISDTNRVTDKGKDFLDTAGKDWRKYPIYIPVKDGEIDWDNAYYGEK